MTKRVAIIGAGISGLAHADVLTRCGFSVVLFDVRHRLKLDGERDFAGTVVTERELGDLTRFDGARVVVVGFGKSALDMATLAAPRAATVHHVFRTPRWTIPC